MSTLTKSAVPVIGMHRSGTSMMARLLEAGGIHFGKEESLAGPSADNPHGFWEHQSIRDLNDALLKDAGGDWRNPPRGVLRQIGNGVSGGVQVEAAEHLQQLDSAATEAWSWKDPRTCLLLPFWKPLLPERRRFLFCLRHPSAVAASLAKRNRISAGLAGFLWQTYNAAAVDALRGEQVLVVSYARLLTDPSRELARIQGFLKDLLPLDLAAMEAAIDPSLAHHQADEEAFLGAWPGLDGLHKSLADCATDAAYFRDLPAIFPPHDPAFEELMAEAARLDAERDVAVVAHEDRLQEAAQARQALGEARDTIASTGRQLEESSRQVETKSAQVASLQAQLEDLQTRKDNLEALPEVRLGARLRRILRRPAGETPRQ